VLAVRVNEPFLDAQRLPALSDGTDREALWSARYSSIRDHEQHLANNGTVVLKFWLDVSLAEQRKRFLERLQTPEKYWKFSKHDLSARDRWDDYMRSYELLLNETSNTSSRKLVSLLHVQDLHVRNEHPLPVSELENRTMSFHSALPSPLAASAADAQHPTAYAAVVDPYDETVETEITEEMISLAIEAIESEQQVWPFCSDVPMVARAPRPSAEIIRFPGC